MTGCFICSKKVATKKTIDPRNLCNFFARQNYCSARVYFSDPIREELSCSVFCNFNTVHGLRHNKSALFLRCVVEKLPPKNGKLLLHWSEAAAQSNHHRHLLDDSHEEHHPLRNSTTLLHTYLGQGKCVYIMHV